MNIRFSKPDSQGRLIAFIETVDNPAAVQQLAACGIYCIRDPDTHDIELLFEKGVTEAAVRNCLANYQWKPPFDCSDSLIAQPTSTPGVSVRKPKRLRGIDARKVTNLASVVK